jgi:hypothetical protein
VSGRTGNICGRNGKKPNERRGQINQMIQVIKRKQQHARERSDSAWVK